MTRFCSCCRRNGHTLMYCRPKAFDDQIRRQQTRNNQERRTVFTHDYNKRKDRTLGFRITKISISNPDTENRITRHPIDKLASTHIGTEIQTHIDNSNKPDQATPGTTDQITVNKLSITSTLDQRALILSTTETFHRATTYLHPTQFNSLTIKEKM